MLVNCDAKALEWVTATWLSNDKVAINEIINNVDQHTDNQQRFGLPSRLIAKTFVFRLIYGGTAYSYANDPDFIRVSKQEKFWQRVIDDFYDKYKGLASWHVKLMQTVSREGKLVLPTGRVYAYAPEMKRGELVWPRTTILNYPVQGSGADIMCLVRVSFYRRFKERNFEAKIVSTVHDSITVDAPDHEVEAICQLFHEVFNDVPMNLNRIFGIDFPIPTRCEVEYGKNLDETTVWVPKDLTQP